MIRSNQPTHGSKNEEIIFKFIFERMKTTFIITLEQDLLWVVKICGLFIFT